MTLTIERGIPYPGSVLKCGRPASYPFEDMEVGDSFEVDTQAINAVRNTSRAALKYCKKHPKKIFAVRRIAPRSRTYRCWRIK